MNFVTSVFKKYIKNETQQESERTSKLLAETSSQKPRRSVLKEFDPFAPDSPCPPREKNKPTAVIDEEDIFEDAETSLTSSKLPRNTKTPNKITDGATLLIPELNFPNIEEQKNPNDTGDLSFMEAVENLSQIEELSPTDKITFEEDFELNTKKTNNNPNVTIQGSENKLLDITTDVEKGNSLNDGTMIDSLENTLDDNCPIQLNTTIENFPSSVIENQVKKHEEENINSMVDSLEISDPQNKLPVYDITVEQQNVPKDGSLIDSLEVVKVEDQAPLITDQTTLPCDKQYVDDKMKIDIPELTITFEVFQNNETVSAENNFQVGDNEVENITREVINQPFESNENQVLSPEIVKSEENTATQIAKQEPNSTQSIENHTEPTVSNEVLADNIEKTNLEPHIEPSVILNTMEDINATYDSEEKAAESSRVMEILAQSLNQTIDVEESAIVDGSNSSNSINTSGNSSKENLCVTLENVPEVTQHTETEPNKVLERKETKEFEDLEKQYSEKAQNEEMSVKKAVDNNDEAVRETTNEENATEVVDQDYSKIYLRQDTQEFEVLERKCKEDVPDTCNVEETENTTINTTFQEKEIKVIKRQETEEFEDLERRCEASIDHSKNLSDNLKSNEDINPKCDEPTKAEVFSELENKEMLFQAVKSGQVKDEDQILLEKTDVSETPVTGQAKVKVSGNVCLATSVCNETEQINSMENVEQPLIEDKENRNRSKGMFIEISVDNDRKPTPNKTNKTRINENIVRATVKPECRPNIRSMRNKTQVIDKPMLINDTTREINDEKIEKIDNTLVEKEKNESLAQELNEYTVKMENQVNKLEVEIDTMKKENERKDEYILTCTLNVEVHKELNTRFKNIFKEYEYRISYQNTVLEKLKKEAEENSKRFAGSEMAFATIFKKYEKAKAVIEAYKKNEEILQRNVQNAEDQLIKLDAKCSVMKTKTAEQLKIAEELINEEKEKHKTDIGKLQAMVKRLEIKICSLETALKQKTEECQALSALYDDVTGN